MNYSAAQNYTSRRNSQGFTLVEVAIALVIIAVIAGGMFLGSNMVHTAKLDDVQSKSLGYIEAMYKFDETYGGLPGDIANATSFFNNCGAGCNGNGNGSIDTASEELYFWRHMQLAGLVEGDFDGTTATPGSGVPKTGFDGAGIRASNDNSLGIVLELTGYSGGAADHAALTPREAWQIDKKFDDGKPSSGRIVGLDGSDTPGGCIIAGGYKVDSGDKGCRLKFAASAKSKNDSGDLDQAVGCGDIGDVVVDYSTSCPTGYYGHYIKTCQKDGTLKDSHNTCEMVSCGGGVFSNNRDIGCPPGYTGGSVTQTCLETGIWKTTAINGCAPTDLTASCSSEGEFRTVNCPAGQGGRIVQKCASGNWTEHARQCSDAACDGQAVGETRSAAGCPVGYTGNITETCTEVGWVQTQSSCEPDQDLACATVGDIETLSCPAGQKGNITRKCVTGAPNHWSVITDTCSNQLCGGLPVGHVRLSQMACDAGYTGYRQEVCTANGMWDLKSTADSKTCSLRRCVGSVTTEGNAVWPDADAGQTVSASSCLAGFSGSPSRECAANGTWGGVVSPCTAAGTSINLADAALPYDTYTTGGLPVKVDDDLTVASVDPITSATVEITSNFVSGSDYLHFTASGGIAGAYNSGTGVLTLTGTTTAANYQTVLRSVAYRNASVAAGTVSKNIKFTVTSTTSANDTRAAALTATAFDATTLGTLKIWLSADVGTTKDGSNRVSAWQDRSGNANHMAQGTAANRPIYVASHMNGRPGLSFTSASAQRMISGSNLGFSGDTALSTFFAGKPAAVNCTWMQNQDKRVAYGFTDWSAGNSFGVDPYANQVQFGSEHFEWQAPGNCFKRWNKGILFGPVASFPITSSERIISVVKAAGAVNATTNYYLNGSQLSVTNPATAHTDFSSIVDYTPSFNDLPFVVGGWFDSNDYNYEGHIHEVLFYASALSDTDRAKVDKYLAAKWWEDTMASALTQPTP